MQAFSLETHLEEGKIILHLPHKNPLTITKDDLQLSYFSGGKGGQNVNRHMNGVRLIYRIPADYQLPFRKTKELMVKCMSQRKREKNFQEALFHLIEKLKSYFYLPPHRKATKMPSSAKRQRLEEKKHRSEVKMNRQRVDY